MTFRSADTGMASDRCASGNVGSIRRSGRRSECTPRNCSETVDRQYGFVDALLDENFSCRPFDNLGNHRSEPFACRPLPVQSRVLGFCVV